MEFYLVVRYANRLICIFMNILVNENIWNERKITEKIMCVRTKFLIHKLLTILDHQN